MLEQWTLVLDMIDLGPLQALTCLYMPLHVLGYLWIDLGLLISLSKLWTHVMFDVAWWELVPSCETMWTLMFDCASMFGFSGQGRFLCFDCLILFRTRL